MSQNEDKVFMRHFTSLMVFLVIFTFVIAFFGAYLGDKFTSNDNPSQQANTKNSLQSPVAVYTGNEAPKLTAPITAVVATPDVVAVADVETTATTAVETSADIDGAAIYQTACFACHGTGAAGAPKLEAAAWTDRLAQGEDTLVDHAVNGFNAMPPKGGQMQLSDDEIRAIVQYMLSQVQ